MYIVNLVSSPMMDLNQGIHATDQNKIKTFEEIC
jgi:hypothetical protein